MLSRSSLRVVDNNVLYHKTKSVVEKNVETLLFVLKSEKERREIFFCNNLLIAYGNHAVCVCARGCVRACAEHGTGAKHNRRDEKNTSGLAHSRASRYHCVTNRKVGERAEPAQARDAIGRRRRGCTCGRVSVCPRPCRQLQRVRPVNTAKGNE